MIDSTAKMLDTSVYRNKIKDVAESKGYNLSQLSRAADIPFSTLRRAWKNPQRPISTALLDKIARTLGVRITDLIEDIPEG